MDGQSVSKEIPQEIKDLFAEFCEERFNDEDCCGEFSVVCLSDILDFEANDGMLWQFAADDPEVYDFYDLFDSCKKYEVEEHGHDCFFIVERGIC